MTPQEIFDKALLAMREQGVKSSEDRFCSYYTREGLRCPAGHLLSEQQARELQGRVPQIWKNVAISDPDMIPEELRGHEDLIADIQKAHDSTDETDYCGSFIKGFEAKMANVAKVHGLSMEIAK